MAVATIQQGSRPASVYLLEPHAFDPAHPKYTPPHGMQIIEVLPVGTRLRIEQLLMKENMNWTDLWVTASKDWGVDPDMLEKTE